jgi:hypothetical protein
MENNENNISSRSIKQESSGNDEGSDDTNRTAQYLAAPGRSIWKFTSAKMLFVPHLLTKVDNPKAQMNWTEFMH